MTAITWNALQTELQAIIARIPAPYTATDFAFETLFPQATSYAENRIYREIPMLAQRAQDTSLVTVSGTRNINLSATALPVIVPERLALLTPTGSTLANGTQIQFIPTSLDFIDMCWPAENLTAAPGSVWSAYWALRDDHTAIIAPTPDAAYTVVLTGLFQQAPISNSNQTTYLSTYYPELLTAGCMIFISGALLRNYGSAGGVQPDEPGMPIHWEGQFKELLAAARQEEMRRRQQGTNWMDMPPQPQVAAPMPPGRAV